MFKILHLIPSLSGGGAERQLLLLAREQARRGQKVHVGVRRGAFGEEWLRRCGVHVHHLGDHKSLNPLLMFGINSLIKEIRPDVVQTWLPQMDIVGGLSAILNSSRWILSERSCGEGYSKSSLITKIRCSLARYATAIVANSTGGALYWREKLPEKERIYKVANAILLEEIEKPLIAKTNDQDTSHIVGHQFLVVGRLIPSKAVDVVIKAVKQLPEDSLILLSILGDGPEKVHLQELLASSRLENKVILHPYTDSWWPQMNSARGLISMSRFEGQPNVVLEAMAAGCPLIVSDIPAHREFLDESMALFVPLDDHISLSSMIQKLISDPDAAQFRAQKAAAWARNLTIQATADYYEPIYTGL